MTFPTPEPSRPSIAVIVPLYNNARHLPCVLPPLLAALGSGAVAELLVVDDGSGDDGPEQCRRAGLRVIPSGGRLGPAACRNLGAGAARSEILLFIDSDVVMHPDVPARVSHGLAADSGCVAIFGSYDASPPAPGIVSRYRNLLHHYTHQQGNEQARTFWAGCGAVRRQAFLEVGGFDARRYPRPAIEDIELGYRLRRRGYGIRLDRSMRCTHRKQWTLRTMLATDVFQRALPWGRLLLETGESADLNVTTGERLKAVLALAFWAALALVALRPAALLIAAALLLAAAAVNRRFLLLVRRQNGALGALGALFLHQLYYLYSTLAFAYCLLEWTLRRRSRDAVRESPR